MFNQTVIKKRKTTCMLINKNTIRTRRKSCKLQWLQIIIAHLILHCLSSFIHSLVPSLFIERIFPCPFLILPLCKYNDYLAGNSQIPTQLGKIRSFGAVWPRGGQSPANDDIKKLALIYQNPFTTPADRSTVANRKWLEEWYAGPPLIHQRMNKLNRGMRHAGMV